MATYAVNRGWGDPPVPTTNIKTVVLSNGAKLPVHKSIANLVKWLGDETIRRGYEIHGDQSWGYAPRRIRGMEKSKSVGSWSNHAYGLAVDLNSQANPMTTNGKIVSDMPSWVPALWKAHGFGWGGDYPITAKSKRKDPMHFEFMGKPSDVAKYIPKMEARTLRIGMTGLDVKGWQKILIGAGELADGTDDGIFGPKTQAATKRFQSTLGVGVDGIAGPKTHKATLDLLTYLAASTA